MSKKNKNIVLNMYSQAKQIIALTTTTQNISFCSESFTSLSATGQNVSPLVHSENIRDENERLEYGDSFLYLHNHATDQKVYKIHEPSEFDYWL